MSQGESVAKRRHGKWNIDMTLRKGERQQQELPSPPGYGSDRHQAKETVRGGGGTDQALIDKKGWDVALAPIKSLPMNVFLMYMSGNTISIFPIMMVGMMFFRPVQALMGIKNTMKMLERARQYYLLTLVFMLGNIMAIGLAVYKCHSMGLLPTHESDWLAFVSPLERKEYVSGGVGI
ncbi:ER membrane protein complex subunit 4-like [Styela clava]|uniref:ER membrane protein complex subunit 4-like n=1 Tax=Styela clava TaxID=7725 RepID=UPI001939BF1F|nr:ER membrane protein complex subunit 4-like [Styela clava]